MSLTCVHSIADARAHTECAGCRGVVAAMDQTVGPLRFDDINGLLGEIRTAAASTFGWTVDEVHNATQGLTNATRPMPEFRGTIQDIAAAISNLSVARPLARIDERRYASQYNQRPATIIDGDWTFLPMPRPPLLPDRALTPEERAAHDEDPRPGVWAGEHGADLRALMQEETDTLIRAELVRKTVTTCDYSEVSRIAVGGGELRVKIGEQNRWAIVQRGGIDSDPLVRLLAYRAWGDRDRQWFELRGVRKGDILHCDQRGAVRAYFGESSITARPVHDAGPGESVKVEPAAGGWDVLIVGDRLRADPTAPRALTPAEARGQAYHRMQAAVLHFIGHGVPSGELWMESSVDPGAEVLWHAPGGQSAPVEERQILARTWVESGELQYEGPEVAEWGESVLARTYDAVQRTIRANHVSIDPLTDSDSPLRVHSIWDAAPRVPESDIRGLLTGIRDVTQPTRWDTGATADDLAANLQAMADYGMHTRWDYPTGAAAVAAAGWIEAAGYRPGDRATSSTGAEYVVTAVDGNRLTLSSLPPAPAPPAGGMRSPAAKPQPPVPRWAKKKRTHGAARSGR